MSNEPIVELLKEVLAAVRDVDSKVDKVNDKVAALQQENGSKIAVLESAVKIGITGNGQPSRLAVVETKLEDLQHLRWRDSGIVACALAVLTISMKLVPIVIKKLF